EFLFFAPQALTVLRWGRLSNRFGRKPVLAIGPSSGACISMLCFSLSMTFWSLPLHVRFLNGNVGVMKATMGELTDSTNLAQASALFPIVWCIGSFAG
ncbi:hypothetical protein EDB19DRAFT_1574420, partial [Suillus lakei]